MVIWACRVTGNVSKLNCKINNSLGVEGFIGMLLVSRSRLVKENAIEVFHHYGVVCALLS